MKGNSGVIDSSLWGSGKRHLLFLTVAFFLAACKKEETPGEEIPVYDSAAAYTLANVSYGSHSQQVMDVYLPANRNGSSTKVFVLIHGGGWSAGDKADFTSFFNAMKSSYPSYGIVNLNYRLGTMSSPGYPKQIQDIEAALSHIKRPEYGLSAQYFLFGSSAGGHLAMLYSYAFDPAHTVKGICNTVGPADLTDPAYTGNNLQFMPIFSGLLGNVTYAQNPSLYAEVSPAKKVTASSPPTISFYGDADPLIPSSQMGLLHGALNAHGVTNEATMYAAGHGDWDAIESQDYVLKIMNFIGQHFE